MDEQSLPTQISRLASALLQRGESLATAESCTGGWLAKCLTDLAGSSRWFVGGVVSYSNPLKQSLLGVVEDVFRRHGAVSEQCAKAMAQGACQRMNSDWAVSITGVAGPGGGSVDKPVGTVWFGVASGQGVEASLETFSGDRNSVRIQSVAKAVALLNQAMEDV